MRISVIGQKLPLQRQGMRSGAMLGMLAVIASFSASAIPVNPVVKNISSYFSVDSQSRFHLFADSTNSKLVWYVPKLAGIARVNDKPQLAVTRKPITEGPFSGLDSVSVQGTFASTGYQADLTRLQSEAIARGWQIKPAQALAADTQVLLAGFAVDGSGQLRVQCDEQTWQTPAGPVVIPVCKALNADGVWQEVDFMSQFSSTLAQAGSVDQQLPFAGETLPGWEATISELLQTGSNWDGLMQLAIDWQLPSYRQLNDSRITLTWRPLTQYLRQQASAYGWRLTLNQVNAIILQAVQQRQGVVIDYYNQANWQSSPVDPIQRARVEQQVVAKIRRYAFSPLFARRLPMAQMAQKLYIANPLLPANLPTQFQFEQKWGAVSSRIYQQFPTVEQRYYDAVQVAGNNRLRVPICETPMMEQATLTRIIIDDCEPTEPPELPVPIEPPPPPPEVTYVLKSNYFWLLRNMQTQFVLQHTDIEQIFATTLLGIDCITGDIDVNLSYLQVASCDGY